MIRPDIAKTEEHCVPVTPALLAKAIRAILYDTELCATLKTRSMRFVAWDAVLHRIRLAPGGENALGSGMYCLFTCEDQDFPEAKASFFAWKQFLEWIAKGVLGNPDIAALCDAINEQYPPLRKAPVRRKVVVVKREKEQDDDEDEDEDEEYDDDDEDEVTVSKKPRFRYPTPSEVEEEIGLVHTEEMFRGQQPRDIDTAWGYGWQDLDNIARMDYYERWWRAQNI